MIFNIHKRRRFKTYQSCRYFGRARDLPGVRELFEKQGKKKEEYYFYFFTTKSK
jgi:hypothetical protein